MAKTLIEVDEEQLAAAQQILHTQTKKDTVNTALRMVISLAARRRDLERLTFSGLPDLAEEDVMRAAWQQYLADTGALARLRTAPSPRRSAR